MIYLFILIAFIFFFLGYFLAVLLVNASWEEEVHRITTEYYESRNTKSTR